MKLPDTNVLFNAVEGESVFHAQAKEWLEAAFNHPDGVALAWVALLGFLRISTRAGITRKPLPVAEALAIVEGWLMHPHARIIQPGAQHFGIVGRLLMGASTGGNLTTDAHLAALAIEHNAEVGTFDRDFRRFSGVRLQMLA